MSDSFDRSERLTRRTATVTISAPEAACARAISWKLRYFPVPTISREPNARPAMTRESFMIVAPDRIVVPRGKNWKSEARPPQPFAAGKAEYTLARVRGVGFGSHGVELVDGVAITLLDLTAAQLHGVGHLAVSKRKILRQQDEPL